MSLACVTMSSYTIVIESVVDNKKRRVLVKKNALEGKTARYIVVYGGRLGAESDDVVYIFDKCYDTVYVNDRRIKTPKWALDLCMSVKKCRQKKKK